MGKGSRIFSILILFIIFPGLGYSYDNQNMHPEINRNAAKQSMNLNSRLKDLGFTLGVESVINKDKVWVWFRKGGKEEDEPQLIRPANHFHDPLEPWESAGWLYVNNSSLLFAQDPIQLYSWIRARNSYYDALKTGDESHYVATFETLGHIMHLISDTAVPAHVRHDTHLPPWGIDPYEHWVQNNYTGFSGIKVPKDIFGNAVNRLVAPVPISALWDQDKYLGNNPEDTKNTIPNFSEIGLAEYTNANFFSKDTIFKEYQHPAYVDTDYNDIDWLNPELTDAEDGVTDNKIYIRGNVGGADTIRLATVSYFTWDLLIDFNLFSNLLFDDKVYEDYASKLIPRAIGYSAALLDYFFRGQIDMVHDPDSGETFILNQSDEILDGTFSLYYDAADGSRYPVPGASWTKSILPGDSSLPVVFTPPEDPAPKTLGKYILVFQGVMGNEDGAVVGRVVPLCEENFSIQYDTLDMKNGETQILNLADSKGNDYSCSRVYWNIADYAQPADWSGPSGEELLEATIGDMSKGWLTNIDGTPLVGKASKVIFHAPLDQCAKTDIMAVGINTYDLVTVTTSLEDYAYEYLTIDFESLPDGSIPYVVSDNSTDIPGGFGEPILDAYAVYGVYFSADGVPDQPIFSNFVHGDNWYAGSFHKDLGGYYNIIIQFDDPVYGIKTNYSVANGTGLIMTARDADGDIVDQIGGHSSGPYDFSNTLTLNTCVGVSSIQFIPTRIESGVEIDNLQIKRFQSN